CNNGSEIPPTAVGGSFRPSLHKTAFFSGESHRRQEGVHNVSQTVPEFAFVRKKLVALDSSQVQFASQGSVSANNSLTNDNSFFDKLISSAVLKLKLRPDQSSARLPTGAPEEGGRLSSNSSPPQSNSLAAASFSVRSSARDQGRDCSCHEQSCLPH